MTLWWPLYIVWVPLWPSYPVSQWEFPVGGIFLGHIPLHSPYIGLIYGRYLQFGFLKWPSIFCFNGKIHYKLPFSIAMFVYQRVSSFCPLSIQNCRYQTLKTSPQAPPWHWQTVAPGSPWNFSRQMKGVSWKYDIYRWCIYNIIQYNTI